MDTRRDFIKKAVLLSGATGLAGVLPASIQRALNIEPSPGTTYLDAEHIVLLMQENRSFDHTYGTLRGVRGFNDPRAIHLPNKNKVWLQTNHAGETYAPFRLDIKDTKITWMGSLPHGRASQVNAMNKGRYDQWLEAKKSGEPEYKDMPLTMGYYTRDDIPFYYALADAFTVCDQNFCSSLTGTDPNRLYFWSGTVRERLHESARPFVQNDDVERGVEWETFPEVLEKEGISWKVYQNEISVEGGFTEEEDVWLGNFGDNPLEYFAQYNVKLSKRYINYLPKKIAKLKEEIASLETTSKTMTAGSTELAKTEKQLKEKRASLTAAQQDEEKWTEAKFNSLPQAHKNIHEKAFVTNTKDPDRHKLTPLNYKDENIGREINIPKGDVLHQFRADVHNGTLPTVSWLVAPECFSDHPSAPWFGSWYLSEAMDILTQDPEVWKKTIFILAYDENDGYFDHVPPFIAPAPGNPATGATSPGIDTSVEQVTLEHDSPGSIGLGYRVPLVVASPWSRGGWVNSQVFDHTSSIQFLEKFLSKKMNKKIEQTHISKWRRTVCGDLSSVFRTADDEKLAGLPFLARETFIEGIYNAKFKNIPNSYKKLTDEDIQLLNRDPHASPYMPQQEKGVRPSCALPYQLYADGSLEKDSSKFTVRMSAGNEIFGDQSAGSPFHIYAPSKYGNETCRLWSFGVAAGDILKQEFDIAQFENNQYHLCVYGPNGFFREFKGNKDDFPADISCSYQLNKSNQKQLTGNIELLITNEHKSHPLTIEIIDNAYKSKTQSKTFGPVGSSSAQAPMVLDLNHNSGWYDFSVRITGPGQCEKRFAGHVETGKPATTDPLMGGDM